MTNQLAFAAEQLKQIIEKIERLEIDKQNISEDIKEVIQHAKNEGFDISTIKKVLKLRKMDKSDIVEQDELLNLYRSALDI